MMLCCSHCYNKLHDNNKQKLLNLLGLERIFNGTGPTDKQQDKARPAMDQIMSVMFSFYIK